MNRPFSQHTQGVLLVVIGVIALVGGVLLEVLDHHLDDYMTWKTPVVIVVGIVAIAAGILRLRGKITN